jgi:hypothetical protein
VFVGILAISYHAKVDNRGNSAFVPLLRLTKEESAELTNAPRDVHKSLQCHDLSTEDKLRGRS